MRRTVNLNPGWSFRRLDDEAAPATEVDLPHSPFVSDLDGRNHWFGVCEYRRELHVPAREAGERVVLCVGAAMQKARVLLNDREVARHEGGFLPFEVDLTEALAGAATAELALRLDNREDPDIPPGKPYAELDFCWYGGLYRSVELQLRPALHITSAISAGVEAGGGVFLRTLAASDTSATIAVRVHLQNLSPGDRNFQVRAKLLHAGAALASAHSPAQIVRSRETRQVELEVTLEDPKLWSLENPHLHEVLVSLVAPDGKVVDECRERFGIRQISFSRSGGFQLNGRRRRLRGTNRHQDMPAVGYAFPRAAQYRDALRIKQAGFDYVRLSHYPQSPDFLAACDELGLVAMNCIPGWQFFGGAKFAAACVENARQLVRRDRNHACVVLWELSLNETAMDPSFTTRLHEAGHAEYPGDQMYTCGWVDRYDVFIHARQHGLIRSWHNGDKALVVSEYGDWEFYASNQGFEQTTGAGVLDPAGNSRQLRGSGERGLRQQAANHLIALNDSLASAAVLDGQWAVFDYPRGYDAKRAAVGVMDFFRLPKYSYYFYRSQRDAGERIAGAPAAPEVFIASNWTAASDLNVLVFSNCEEVELLLNGRSLGRRTPTASAQTQHLPHPPVGFELEKFQPGTLEAIGYMSGKACAQHRVATPGPAAFGELAVADAGIFPASGEPDVLIAHARLRDAQGTLCVEELEPVAFRVEGAELLGPALATAEAGIASVVLRLPPQSPGFTVTASCPGKAAMLFRPLAWTRSPVLAEPNPDGPRAPHFAGH